MGLPTGERNATSVDTDVPARGPLGNKRAIAVAVAVVVFIGSWWVIGPPTTRLFELLWILVIVLTASAGRGRSVWRILLDWLPLFAILWAYDWTRGFARDLGIPVHYRWPISADRFLFHGTVPTAWLQAHLYTPETVHWYDAVAGLIYLSHFFVGLALGTALYLQSREIWSAYMRRFVALSLAGLATYALYPAAPPWLAARNGLLPGVMPSAITHRGLEAWGFAPTATLLRQGAAHSNQVAAVPSLHAAFSLFVALFIIGMGRRPLRRLWVLAYPLVMAFSVVYTGEHYVIDVLLGWLYAVAVMVGCSVLERRYLSRSVVERADDAYVDVSDVGLQPAKEQAGLLRRSLKSGPRNADVRVET
jgi:membrane-associated phospholipid phosphatase